MGLEIVELIMRIEEEFEITIADNEAELLATPGNLCHLIEGKLGLASAEKASFCPTSHAFYFVRRELMQQNIERARITPATSLESLWPRSERRKQWQSLAKVLDTPLPPLERSPQWAFAALLPLGIFPVVLVFSPAAFIPLVAAYIALWIIGVYATKPLAVHTPSHWQTVGDLSRHLAPRFYESEGQALPEVWTRLRHIIADEFDLPLEKVTRDAHFVRDLGLG